MQLPRPVPAFLRREPTAAHRAAIGAIALGVVIFVFASLNSAVATTALPAGTHHSAAPVTPAGARWGYLMPITPPAAPAPTVTTAPLKELPAKPVTVAKKAPTSSTVISGLAANGIPTVALNAYRVAAARLASADPSCGIDWALLAGIGREESDHGRFGGAVLHADGTSTPRIIGPALDGKHWDYVPAPPNGRALDGDAVYAHALGPMQFIPSTWATYGIDANGDGKADIFNINDAALAAARYLCAAGGNLRTHAGQVRAVLAYNHNDQYLAQVLALADAYRRGVKVTGIPQGTTTGALPPVHRSGSTPPVNPGGPTAVDSGHSTPKPTPSASSSGSSGHVSTAPSSSPKPTTGSSSSTPSKPHPTSTPTPSPTPTPTPSGSCKLPLGSVCLIP
jgi:membrane-bound lytic murein transglycosylase B